MDSLKIAVIPGDGIGTEVIPEGMRALETAGNKHVSVLSGLNLTGPVRPIIKPDA